MIKFDKIPEKDKVCINCIYFGYLMDRGDETMCGGERPCCNYHEDNDENYFVPDDDYLKSEYGCEACEHYYGGEPSEECGNCRRYYEDLWSRAEGG